MNRRSPSSRVVLLGGYLLVVAAATLLWAPVPMGLTFQDRLRDFLSPGIRGADLIDAIRNVALFTGWGLVWVLTSRPTDTLRRTLVLATLSGALASLAVELGQLFFTLRTASLLDVATNALGATAGVLATWTFLRLLERAVGRRSYVGIPAALLACSYAGACVGEALIPLFRQTIAPNAWGPPSRRLAAALALFSADAGWAPVPWGDFPLFLPVGMFAAAALMESGWERRRAGLTVAVLGVAGAWALEFGHGYLGVPIRLGAATLHAVAVVAGAALAAWGLPAFSRSVRGARRLRWLYPAYGAVLAAWLLRPYRLALDGLSLRMKLSFPWWIPLGDARYRADLFSVIDVFGSFLLFLPLGALLAVWPLRLRGPAAGVLPAVALAFGLEACQFLIAARTPTVTDPLVQTAAVVIGWYAARSVGFPRYGTVLRGHEVRPPGTVDAPGRFSKR